MEVFVTNFQSLLKSKEKRKNLTTFIYFIHFLIRFITLYREKQNIKCNLKPILFFLILTAKFSYDNGQFFNTSNVVYLYTPMTNSYGHVNKAY